MSGKELLGCAMIFVPLLTAIAVFGGWQAVLITLSLLAVCAWATTAIGLIDGSL
jgi:ABC-type proline/glycine betaine transport system permease subunit